MQNNADSLYPPQKTMRPEQRTNRGKAHAVRSTSPPGPRPSKITKRTSPHVSSKLRQQVTFTPEPESNGEEDLRDSSQETAGRAAPKQTMLEASWADEDHDAAFVLFNMRTSKPRTSRQSMLTIPTIYFVADIPPGDETDLLGTEIRQYEEQNRRCTAAQILMPMRHVEPPHGAGAWKNTGFRILPHEDWGLEASDMAP